MVYHSRIGMNPRKTRNVLVLLWSSKASVRTFLSGFVTCARKRKNWIIHLHDATDLDHPPFKRKIRAGAYDGIVVNEDTFLVHPEIASNPKTALVLHATYDPARRKAGDNLVYIQQNNAITGAFGADYLLRHGAFASYAFVPVFPERSWSKIRAESFAERITRKRGKCFVHDGRVSLVSFLRSLPKPAAVMAACDRVALQVLECCRKEGFKVPEKIAVLGVDNDELICEFARPSLTSIHHTPPENCGMLAARALDSIFRGKRYEKPGLFEDNQLAVAERESCAQLPPAKHIAYAAMEYIQKNATRDVRVPDVVKTLGVSTRLASMRFREIFDKSILEAIVECRLKEVERRLTTSRLPISKIAALCNFDDLSYLGRIFRKRHGVTMSQFRDSAV